MAVENGTAGSEEDALLGAAMDLVKVDVNDPTFDLDATLSRFTAATDIIDIPVACRIVKLFTKNVGWLIANSYAEIVKILS